MVVKAKNKPSDAEPNDALGAPEREFAPMMYGAARPITRFLDETIGQWSLRAFSKRLDDERYFRRTALDKYRVLGEKVVQSPLGLEVFYAICYELASCDSPPNAFRQSAAPFPDLQPPAEMVEAHQPSEEVQEFNRRNQIPPNPHDTPEKRALRAWVGDALTDWETRQAFSRQFPLTTLGLFIHCAEADHLVDAALPNPHTREAKAERRYSRLQAVNHRPMQW